MNFVNLFGTGIAALKNVLWPVFGLIFVIYVLVTFVLVYHWRRYGMRKKKIILAETVYFIGSLLILAVSIFSLVLFNL